MSESLDDQGRVPGPRSRPPSRTAVRQAAYRRRRRSVAGIGLGLVVFAVVVAVAVMGGSSAPSPTRAISPSTTIPSPTTTTSSTNITTTTPATTDPGLLAQTTTEPPTDPTSLVSRLDPLWTAIQTGSLPTGMTVFFPQAAYLKMKSGVLPNPPGDYQSRLVALYNMDLGTYQAALGIPASSARLVTIGADPSIAHWVPPGACANTIGYWHLPNIRIDYASGGTESSFGVFSLISWRGAWYVIHLGPVPRTSGSGLLDLPAAGPGTPGPGGGC